MTNVFHREFAKNFENTKYGYAKILLLMMSSLLGLLLGYFIGLPKAHSASNSLAVGQAVAQTRTYTSKNLFVQLNSFDASEIKYTVTLADGTNFDVSAKHHLNSLHFPTLKAEETKAELAYYRTVLETFGNLAILPNSFEMAAVPGHPANRIYTYEMNHRQLNNLQFQAIDPLHSVFTRINPLLRIDDRLSAGYRVGQVTFQLIEPGPGAREATEVTIDPKESKPQALKKAMQFLLDSIVLSTFKAGRYFRNGHNENIKTWDERGFQFAIKAELVIGVGRVNISRAFSITVGVGYNRKSGSVVWRRGFRTEKLADGANMSIGGKIEIKGYQINSIEADSRDPRKGFAVVEGRAWSPPFPLPVIAPVLESGRGYQSIGFAIGANFAELSGSFLLNTVTSFVEPQRVYETKIPAMSSWLPEIKFNGIPTIDNFLANTTVAPNSRGIYSIGSMGPMDCGSMFFSVR